MKQMIAGLVVAAVALGGVAQAGDKGDWDAKMADKFAKIDSNGDGVVSEAEYMAYKSSGSSEKFAKLAGDDGQLTLDEMKAAYKSHKKKGHKKKDH